MNDPHELARFVDAPAPCFEQVLAELEAGRKQTHWMWFIFPQIAGLGTSPMAVRYAIGSRQEAEAYLAHPLLGPRLHDCIRRLLALPPATRIQDVMGSPDDLKLRSSLTLFANVADDPTPFENGLHRFYGGVQDPKTIELLAAMAKGS